MEKIPGLRIIGNASSEDKENAKAELIARLYKNNESFSDKDKEILSKFEIIKTNEEIQIIDLISHEIDKTKEEMGLESFRIPSDNYHILDQEFYEERFGDETCGNASFKYQSIAIAEDDARKNLLFFASIALHESLHLHGHRTLEVNNYEDGEIELTNYREGISILATQKKRNDGEFTYHFNGLHEAIVSEQQKIIFNKIKNNSVFSGDIGKLFSEQPRDYQDLVINSNPNFDVRDIISIDRERGEFESVPYEGPRYVLNFVCEQILKEFPERFSNKEEVFQLFLKSHFTGQLLDIARVVEGTFSEGSFRKLGTMETTSESAEETYLLLRRELEI